jgi:hypothetical protein
MRRPPVTIDAAQTTTINAVVSETFIINLLTSISTLRIKNPTPGLLYIFVLVQNSAGGNTVNWGSQISNATAANPRPNSITIQPLIAKSNGTLIANLPGSWTGAIP